MKTRLAVAALLSLSLATVASERAAEACGGCFAPPGPSTQVSAHRMAFAVSTTRTILWDQIQYVGAPSSFGWVLPIRGKVDVGVSSDSLFDRLESYTTPSISPPAPPTCPAPQKRCRSSCDSFDSPTAGGLAEEDAAASVDVWSTSIVGPYEATQLSSTDTTALKNWLTDHGYVLPDAIVPVIDKYVAEGFGFLAIKLVPTADTSRMVPIRIAFDGASPTLPLRMVAAGTGAKVGIKLFVLGDGRWQSKNVQPAEIATSDLVWDWAAMASNFGTLEVNLIAKYGGKVFITETSDSFSKSALAAGLPPGTVTTDTGTVFSTDTDQSELEKAFPAHDGVTISRLFAELPSSALGADLELEATGAGKIPASRTAPLGVNYSCPQFEDIDCPGVTPTCDGNSQQPTYPSNGATGGSSGGSFGCSTTNAARSPFAPLAGLAAVLALAGFARRRR